MIEIYDLLMTIAGFGFTVSAIPQIILLWKVKKADEVSLLRNTLLALCVGLTIVADIGLGLLYATAVNSIQLILCVTVCIQILYYRNLW